MENNNNKKGKRNHDARRAGKSHIYSRFSLSSSPCVLEPVAGEETRNEKQYILCASPGQGNLGVLGPRTTLTTTQGAIVFSTRDVAQHRWL